MIRFNKETFALLLTLVSTQLAQAMQSDDSEYVQTKLLIRGPSLGAKTLSLLKVNISQETYEGPEGAKINVICKNKERAIFDNNGHFLTYMVGKEGKIYPDIVLNPKNFIFLTKEWPPYKAEVILKQGKKRVEATLPIHYFRDSITGEIVAFMSDNDIMSESFEENILQKNEKVILKCTDNEAKELSKKSIEKMPFFNAVSSFGTVWTVLNMYDVLINKNILSNEVKLRWCERERTSIFPAITATQFKKLYPELKHENFINSAYYDYDPKDKVSPHRLCFFPLLKSEPDFKYTSDLFPMVVHVTAHNVLNILRPDFWEDPSKDMKIMHMAFSNIAFLFSLLHFSELQEGLLKKINDILFLQSSCIPKETFDIDKHSPYIKCNNELTRDKFLNNIYDMLESFLKIEYVGQNRNNNSALMNQLESFHSLFLQAIVETQPFSLEIFKNIFKTRLKIINIASISSGKLGHILAPFLKGDVIKTSCFTYSIEKSNRKFFSHL